MPSEVASAICFQKVMMLVMSDNPKSACMRAICSWRARDFARNTRNVYECKFVYLEALFMSASHLVRALTCADLANSLNRLGCFLCISVDCCGKSTYATVFFILMTILIIISHFISVTNIICIRCLLIDLFCAGVLKKIYITHQLAH